MGLVIGLHGAKGSGKDQFYKAAKAALPLVNVRKIAYADMIKDEVCRIFDLRGEDQYDEFKRTSLRYKTSLFPRLVEGRHVVREIGMLMRRYDPHQFVRYVEDTIKSDPNGIWFITDLRFDNEFVSVKNTLDGIVVKILRGGVGFDGHVTETEFRDEVCDYIIRNVDLTLREYNELVTRSMGKILTDKGYRG